MLKGAGWTVLRVTPAGAVLRDLHRQRFVENGPAVLDAFDRFVADAAPGVYALDARTGLLEVHPRRESMLRDGLPVRRHVSPLTIPDGRIGKPGPPSNYSGIRAPGALTLLTSRDGGELWECCIAAIATWDGERLVLPPPDRPRVDSVAEAALLAAGLARYGLVPATHPVPLVALNAVQGACRVTVAGAPAVPDAIIEAVRHLFALSARR